MTELPDDLSSKKKSSKASVDETRKRFDENVERYSNLETGQTSAVDAALTMSMVTKAASKVNPNAEQTIDIGCGAGNYSLKLLQKLPKLKITLVDLSLPMLQRARERIEQTGACISKMIHGDIREIELPAGQYDIAMAATALHHLRGDEEWENVFNKVYQSLKPGGSFWITDLVVQDHPGIQEIMQENYIKYLFDIGGQDYVEAVLNCIAKEDSPRSVTNQIKLMGKMGFKNIEILHKNACYAAFGGIK